MMKIRSLIEKILFVNFKNPNKFQKFMTKKHFQWIEGQCRHLCCLCEFKKECGIIDDNYVGIDVDKL